MILIFSLAVDQNQSSKWSSGGHRQTSIELDVHWLDWVQAEPWMDVNRRGHGSSPDYTMVSPPQTTNTAIVHTLSIITIINISNGRLSTDSKWAKISFHYMSALVITIKLQCVRNRQRYYHYYYICSNRHGPDCLSVCHIVVQIQRKKMYHRLIIWFHQMVIQDWL